MTTKRKYFSAAICLGLLALVSFVVLRPHQPSYRGKPLKYWLNPWKYKAKESPEEVSAAFRAMGQEAIPFLLKDLKWQPSSLMQKLHGYFPKWTPGIIYEQGGLDPRSRAAYALGERAPAASNAIPQLQVAASLRDLRSSWSVNVSAQAALIKIKEEPLQPYIEKLKATSNLTQWYQNALMIGEFGTNAIDAVTDLITAAGTNNHPVIQAHAAIALGMIHSEPEVCVPALAELLKSPDVGLRQKAIWALPQFGRSAKPALNEIIQCLQDSDPWTRVSATNAIEQIDPETAGRLFRRN